MSLDESGRRQNPLKPFRLYRLCSQMVSLQEKENYKGVFDLYQRQQGRVHGNQVADGWAGAVMRKLLGIQKCDGPTD